MMGLELKNFADRFATGSSQTVLFDQTGDAEIVLGAGSLTYMSVRADSIVSDTLGMATGHVVLSTGTISNGARVIVDRTDIGGITTPQGYNFRIDFNGGATEARVNEVLHALTYTSTVPPQLDYRVFQVEFGDSAGSSVLQTAAIATAPSDAVFLNWDATVAGSTADEVFIAAGARRVSLVGGGGNDTVIAYSGSNQVDLSDYFKSLSDVEDVRGTSKQDIFVLNTAILSSVSKFDAGPHADANNEWIALVGAPGTPFDFTGKTIVNFDAIELTQGSTVTFDSKDTALLARGENVRGEHVILTGQERFTPQERAALADAGIDTITDGSGTTGNLAPVVAGLDGDRLRLPAGGTRLIDQGAQFRLSDDGSLARLDVEVLTSQAGSQRLGIDVTGRVSLSGENGTTVVVDQIEIGTLTI
ncbi:MAG: hypothetical protein ABW026_19715, partial [Microvirga sp.]